MAQPVISLRRSTSVAYWGEADIQHARWREAGRTAEAMRRELQQLGLL